MHPRCRIPPITTAGILVPTERGPLPAERCLTYDRPELLLHTAAATRPRHTFTLAELAGYDKTASRLLAILDAIAATPSLTPLEWLSPAYLVFSTAANRITYDLISGGRLLQQLERILIAPDDHPYSHLIFRRV